MDGLAIKVDNVSKVFKLPHEKQSSIKSVFVNIFRNRKDYELQEALKGVSLEVNNGDFFGIVGRNGSGKSTLLKLLAEIYTPTKGEIQVNGSLTPFIELGVGFNPELTGRENVYLNGALLGFSRKEMKALYNEIVGFAELERFMDQKLKNYSSGMQVRLAFSIAIRAKSDILLIDEVLAVGDSAFQQKCFDYFRQLKKDKRTVVFVSHDLRSIEDFCDKAAIIDRGKLLGVGGAKEIVRQYETILAEMPKTKTDKKTKRPGTGDSTINEVKILNKNNKPVSLIEAGEPFSIEVSFSSHTSADIVAGLAVNDESGTVLFGPNTQEQSYKIHMQPGDKKRIRALFTDNNLSAGTYPITAALFNEAGLVPFDYFENAAKLKVLGEKKHGKIDSRPKWSID